jgi:uncharacterized protein (TIGR03084 family)
LRPANGASGIEPRIGPGRKSFLTAGAAAGLLRTIGLVSDRTTFGGAGMIAQADDFQHESEEVCRLLEATDEARFTVPTGFKEWTFDDILTHLHVWNVVANLSLTDEPAYLQMTGGIKKVRAEGATITEAERLWLGAPTGHELLDIWRDFIPVIAENFRRGDPASRVLWGGRRMSARSSITARLMETWAHAQAIYDLLGVERRNTDRIRNVAVISVNTYDWTFTNRGLSPPEPRPHVELIGPSGAVWTFNAPSDAELVKGSAVEFCQVATHTRNIADTSLTVRGANAADWMSKAQAFAGPPRDPPAPGERRMASV